MTSSRKWIVGLSANCAAPSETPIDAVVTALNQINEWVVGEIVVAAVPATGMLGLLTRLTTLDSAPPLHLIAPVESSSLSEGEEVRETRRQLFKSATSINVQPGRGTTEEDWEDCKEWLDSVSEIDLILTDGFLPGSGKSNSKPAAFVDAKTGGEPVFVNSPNESTTIRDPMYDDLMQRILSRSDCASDSLFKLKEAASELAKDTAPRFRMLESFALVFNLLPSMLFGLGAAREWSGEVLNLATLGTTLAAGVVAFLFTRVEWQKTWISARTTAEIIRSLSASRHFLDPLFPPASIHLPGFSAVARSLALSESLDLNLATESIESARDRYLIERIDHQIDYYTRQGKKSVRKQRGFKFLFYITTILAFTANFFAFLGYTGLAPGIPVDFNDQWLSGFAGWIFPSLAAIAIGFVAIHETSRRASYYYEQASELERRRKTLANLNSESSITESVREIENLLLEEVGEWIKRRLF